MRPTSIWTGSSDGRTGWPSAGSRRPGRGREPEVLVAFHQREDGAQGLRDHRRQVGGACARLDPPAAQPRLVDRQAVGDGDAGDPEVRHAPAGLGPPRLGRQTLQEACRQRAGTGQRLVEAPAEQCADERCQHEVGDRAVVPVARVDGQHQVGAVLEDGPEEALEPLAGDRRDVGLEHQQGADAESPRDADRQAQRRAAAGHAVERHGAELCGRRLVLGPDEGQPAFGEPLHGRVRRAGVGVDQDRRRAGEVLLETTAYGVHDRRHGGGVVVGQHGHRELHRRQAVELPVDVGRELRADDDSAHRVRWTPRASSSASSRVSRNERRTCSRPAAPIRGMSSGLLRRWRMRKAAPSTE